MAETAIQRKRNIAGYYDEQGRFRPIRSPQYVGPGRRKAKRQDRSKYSKAKAGDLGPDKQAAAIEADEFDWATGLTKGQLAADEREKRRVLREIEKEALGENYGSKGGLTLVDFVRSQGGLRRHYRLGGQKNSRGEKIAWDGGEIDRLSYKETGKRGLTTDDPKKGKTIDKMWQAALEAGFDLSDTSDMLDRLEDEATGGRVTYATGGFRDYTKYNPSAPAPKAGTTLRPLTVYGKDHKIRFVLLHDGSFGINGFGKQFKTPTAAKKWATTNGLKIAYDNPGKLVWRQNGDSWFLSYGGELLSIVRKNNAKSYSAEDLERGKSFFFPSLTLAKQKSMALAKRLLPKAKANMLTHAQMLAVVNKTGNKALLARHGKAVRVTPAPFDRSMWAITFADGHTVESRIPKLRNNPEPIAAFAALAGGLASSLAIADRLNRSEAEKKAPARRRANPANLGRFYVANNPPSRWWYVHKIGVKAPFGKYSTEREALRNAALLAKSESDSKRQGRAAETAKAKLAKLLRGVAGPFNSWAAVDEHLAFFGYTKAERSKAISQARLSGVVLPKSNPKGDAYKLAVRRGDDMLLVSMRDKNRDGFMMHKRKPADRKRNAARMPLRLMKKGDKVGLYTRSHNNAEVLIGWVQTTDLALAKSYYTPFLQQLSGSLAGANIKYKALAIRSVIPEITFVGRYAAAVREKSNPGSVARRATFEMFQGREATTATALPASAHAPARLDQLGDLIEIAFTDGRILKTNPDKFKLCAARGKLWIVGGRLAKANPAVPAREINPVGEMKHIVYGTYKPHHGDDSYTHYIHELGEDSGRRPTLCVDRDGFAVVRGGAYKIEARGIVD